MVNKIKEFFNEFLPEVRGEWRKVTKPPHKDVLQTTVVVIVTSFIFAFFLWASDKVIQAIYNFTFAQLGLG